jgi:NADH dehydrogenase (ubiquinone) 1 alpha subcomplex subunit 5
MRSTSRLLATVKSATKYLEPNTPTGLTGLITHPSPRPALIWTYRETLKKLTQIPKNSVYRQSAEALTKHRLEIVETTKPEGYEQWLERVQKQIAASPKAYAHLLNEDGSLASAKPGKEDIEVWDGRITKADAHYEGTNSPAQAEYKLKAVAEEIRQKELEDKEGVLPTVDDLEVEPALTREQYVALSVASERQTC